jgi:hypothetical protein
MCNAMVLFQLLLRAEDVIVLLVMFGRMKMMEGLLELVVDLEGGLNVSHLDLDVVLV